jgi:signal peptidase II
MNPADPQSSEPSPFGDEPLESAPSPGPVDVAIAPDAPRMAAPVGTSAEPPLPSVVAELPASAGGGASYVDHRHPSYLFLATVAIVSLASDIGSKLWAEKRLDGYPNSIPIWKDHLAFVLAKNKGGAWGLLQGSPESVRRPFFLLV